MLFRGISFDGASERTERSDIPRCTRQQRYARAQFCNKSMPII